MILAEGLTKNDGGTRALDGLDRLTRARIGRRPSPAHLE